MDKLSEALVHLANLDGTDFNDHINAINKCSQLIQDIRVGSMAYLLLTSCNGQTLLDAIIQKIIFVLEWIIAVEDLDSIGICLHFIHIIRKKELQV